jgi:RNA polymerase sigma factor (sigma-70 family)
MSKPPRDSSLDMSDGTLVQRSLAGDHEAFATLVERYHSLLVGYVSRWSRDEALVQDIVQHVLLQLYVSLPILRAHLSIQPWLLRVAHNRCVDERSRQQQIPFSQLEETWVEEDVSPFDKLADPGPLPEEVAERHEIQQRIRQAIGALPLKQRSVVWMRYAGQLSYAEIAQRLHIPESTAKTSFLRAKLFLRQALAEEAGRASRRGSTRDTNGEREKTMQRDERLGLVQHRRQASSRCRS